MSSIQTLSSLLPSIPFFPPSNINNPVLLVGGRILSLGGQATSEPNYLGMDHIAIFFHSFDNQVIVVLYDLLSTEWVCTAHQRGVRNGDETLRVQL